MSAARVSYYDRQSAVHMDGTRIFQSASDRTSENEVARAVAAAWSCEIRSFGALSPVDWFGTRDGRVVGVLELKSRSHAREQYPSVFLNVRKWLALSLAAAGLGVPAIFVVRFTDATCWVPLSEIDPSRIRVGGCVRRVKADNDVEPVIEVPVTILREVGK